MDRPRLLALLALVCLGLSWGTAADAAAGHPSTPGGDGATTAAHPRRPPWIKPQILGLVDKSSQTPYLLRQPFGTVNVAEVAPDASAFSGIVVNATWAQLEPGPGHFTFAALRRSLGAVSAYNRVHPGHHLLVKLRFWGGFTAPPWAKALGGAPPVTFATPTATGTTGRWWTRAYRSAWSGFQHRLAASFDADPLIGSVAVSSCATLTAEPFVQSPQLALHTELFAAGWSSPAQQRCLRGAFSDYSGWKHTPIDYAFNPFVAYTPGTNRGTRDLGFTDQVMTQCANLRRAAGRSCILTNHDLTQVAATTSRSAPIYGEIDALYNEQPGRTPVDFQTGPPNNFGDCQAINVAIAHHAQSLELWPPSGNSKGFQGFSAYPETELARWARALENRKQLSC